MLHYDHDYCVSTHTHTHTHTNSHTHLWFPWTARVHATLHAAIVGGAVGGLVALGILCLLSSIIIIVVAVKLSKQCKYIAIYKHTPSQVTTQYRYILKIIMIVRVHNVEGRVYINL